MPSDNKVDPMILAACAAKTYNANHLMAYAHLSTDLTFLQVSPNFGDIALNQPLNDADIIDMPLTDVLWEFVGATDAIQDIVAGKTPMFALEHVNREQPDGSINYVTFLVYALEDEPLNKGLLLLVEDSTAYGRLHHDLVQDRNELRLVQRKLATANEELVTLNRMKSLFLSMAAHDLRTPLSAIHGYSEMLLMGLIELGSEKSINYLDIIHQQSARLNQLIDDIVDLDVIERGKLSIDPSPCDINELINEVITALKFNLERRKITIHNALSPDPMIVYGDSEKLLRVFYNLMGNAIKYTNRNGNIHLRTEKQNGRVIIEIGDDGPGMTKAQQEKLFTLYYRTEEAEESEVTGSGLGLFIVKTMIEAHQGQISVASELKKGTKFTITVPELADSQGTRLI